MIINRARIKYLSMLPLLALLLFPLSVIGSEGLAKLPYDRLLQIQDTMLNTLPKDIPFYLHIFSSDPHVKSSDISLHLVSNNEKIEIELDNRGFIELPIRRDFVGQGAYVVSNQPKGTMVLQGESRSHVPLKNRSIEYSQLISPVVVAESAREIAKDSSDIKSERYIKSIHLFVDQESISPVIIRSKQNVILKIFPDECGNLEIPIDEVLIAKKPVVEFPSDDVFFINPWK